MSIRMPSYSFANRHVGWCVLTAHAPATPLRLTSLRQIASSETGCVHTQPRTAAASPVGAILHCDLRRKGVAGDMA
jgi:hypothetical protein